MSSGSKQPRRPSPACWCHSSWRCRLADALGQALSATAAGAFYGLFPILWILVNALWIYKLTVATPWFEALGRTIRSISDDLRILAILIAFCFGALLESLAGFGAPVAISAAMLMAAGMKPLKVSRGLAAGQHRAGRLRRHGRPDHRAARRHRPAAARPLRHGRAGRRRSSPLIVPLLLVFMVDGRRGVRQTWPVALVAGTAFAVSQFVTSNYFAVELTDVVAAIVTVAAVLLMLRFWKPRETIGMAGTRSPCRDAVPRARRAPVRRRTAVSGTAGADSGPPPTAPRVTRTAPTPTARGPTAHIWMAIAPYADHHHDLLPRPDARRSSPGSAESAPSLRAGRASTLSTPTGKPVAATKFKLDHLKATGTLLLLSGVITMALYRITAGQALAAYRETLVQLRWTIVTVDCVLALAFVMNLSGQTVTLGSALASTGGFFAFLSPVIGWIGVA